MSLGSRGAQRGPAAYLTQNELDDLRREVRRLEQLIAKGGGSVPTGTGWRHVTAGVEDPVASTPPTAAHAASHTTGADIVSNAVAGVSPGLMSAGDKSKLDALPKITVSAAAPAGPSVGDLWVDTH